MIITRAPLRISFAGGGTDIPQFYRKYGPGAVVSTSINKYVYVTLNKKFNGGVSVRYRIHENVDSVKDLKHLLIRECLLAYGIKNGIEIVVTSEVPARGSGLGASSALANALLLALDKFAGGRGLLDNEDIADLAAKIEINKCNSPIGKQYHYASAMGGMNFIQFNQDESVEVKSLIYDLNFYNELESQSMLFYLDIEHKYQDGNFVQKILKDQASSVDGMMSIYQLQRDNAICLMEHMEYSVMERFMDHVNENWRIKKMTHQDISSPEIDKIIQKAYSSGATAAKVCGAGGGGFLYLIVPPSMQDEVRSALTGLSELKFKFDQTGAECIFDEESENAMSES